jgi:hypothetical protein
MKWEQLSGSTRRHIEHLVVNGYSPTKRARLKEIRKERRAGWL